MTKPLTPTLTTQPDQPSPPVIFERSYDDGEVRFTLSIDANHDTEVIVAGRGNMAGAYQMVRYLDEAVKLLGTDRASRIFFDLSMVSGAPLRSQFLFGKWFLVHRHVVERAALVGAGPIERRVASAVCIMAAIRKVRFFERAAEARVWLKNQAT